MATIPEYMVLAINGLAHSGKNSTGSLLAEAVKGVVVDSGSFYRSIALACLKNSIAPTDKEAVLDFCRNMTLVYRPEREQGQARETLVWINGVAYSRPELILVGTETSEIARLGPVREIVNCAMRRCTRFGRVIMLGRDIGLGVLAQEPVLKCFLTAAPEILEERHLKTTGKTGAVRRNEADKQQTILDAKTVLIDTSHLTPEAVRNIILVELFTRLRKLQASHP